MRRRNPSMMASRKMKLLFDESELPGLYCRSSQTLELTVGGRFTFAQHRETGQVLERLPAPLDGQGLHFDRMKLRGADLRRAAPGSEATLNLVEAHLSYKDLSRATLEGQNLTRAHLHDADLKDGDFTGARLVCASVDEACLQGAVLTDADLNGTDLQKSDLTGADLSRARLRGALLCGADLRGAILTEADLHEAIWRGGAVTARRPPDLDLLPGLQASGGSPGRTSDRACRQQHRRQRDADHRSAGDRTGRPVLPAPAADLAAGREACELLPSRRTMVGPRRAIGRRVDAPLSRVLLQSAPRTATKLDQE